MTSQATLLTFASQAFYPQQLSLNKSAVKCGISKCVAWTERELKNTEFYKRHQNILSVERGSGYWLWKPYLILRELESAKAGEFVVYYDVGRPSLPNKITRSVVPLLAWCEANNGGMLPGTYIPEYGRNARWTKRDCFYLMQCDEPKYWNHPQVQATFSIWQKTKWTLDFVEQWLTWCATPGVLTDDSFVARLPNFGDFVAHRHDQSVITNLVIKNGLRCFGDPLTPLPGSKNINNLIDRIRGKEGAIRWRNAARFAERQFNQRILRK